VVANPNFPRLVTTLRARHPLVIISTVEEVEATELVVSAALKLSRPVQRWSVMSGLVEGAFAEDHHYAEESAKPEAALLGLRDHAADSVIVLHDMVDHMDSPVILRGVREVLHQCQRLGSTLVLIDHRSDLPEIIAQQGLRFELELPEPDELDRIARDLLRRLQEARRTRVQIRQADYRAVIDNLRGCSRRQARELLTAAALEDELFDADDIARLAELKRAMLHRDGLLEQIATEHGFDDLAGFTRLKRWLGNRHPARERPGVPAARGMLLLGVPGAGKSYCARTVAHHWQLPLLRLDAGSLHNAWIGESERRLRDALAQSEAMAPCVLWVDEIEKAFASAASRSVDGGLSQRMFGYLLSWMQDHRSPVFLLATANDIQALPAELLRKGRFDQIFFVDLPDAAVRGELFAIHARRYGMNFDAAACERLVAASEGCTGAEIEQALISARIEQGEAESPPAVANVVALLQESPPLSVTMAEHIAALRSWAEGRCVPA